MERPSTPPRRIMDTSLLQVTPEHVKQIEINRLKAKAAQRQREQEASSSSSINTNNKRNLVPTPAGHGSPTAPVASSSKPLKRDSRLGTYFEYDLSKMVNTKGGFLVDEGSKVDEDLRRKEKEREKQRDVHNLDLPMYLDPALNPKCQECQTMDIDPTFLKVFKCRVCKTCQNEKPEKYSLLTKTECKLDYLLTDPELRDQELLPHLLKANPHKSTYANMMLFLRCQVEEFAWKKWGSPEVLDAEYERRAAEKKTKKNKKFEQSLKDLRRRTKEGVWQRRKDEEHKHIFSQVQTIRGSFGKQVCHEYSLNQVEHEQISTSLEVEQIEVNLFRSKSLWLPLRARGVFGGQVISQALVSATNCVDSVFALHCYFLTSASPATPIVYSVERLRDGKSYVTRSVKAVQNGQIIFIMLCSFQKPEIWQPTHQWTMPEVPPPEQCQDEEVTYARERSRSPIAIKHAKVHHVSEDGTATYMYWMKARDVPQYEAPFQKCILAYISDMHFISTAFRIMGLKTGGTGPDSLSMTVSALLLVNDFDAGDWLLYEIDCPRAGSGRAVVHGRMFTRDGKLVAVTSQEGVVRANIRGPPEGKKLQTKL
ncbi:thioesterase-like superfamily-domain-containing protein [Crassisporium funariophilum]|nr:thioesterase-like superfamily-domain-containing protein [Crassisporium funariophilum]